MRQSIVRWRAASPEETEAIGARLAASLPTRADAPTIVYLTGDLGAGKTTLARGFIRGYGIEDAVHSPTYALLEPYDGPKGTVLHLDLYRLRDPAELDALGLRDWAQHRHVWLIEWPEKGGARLPPADVQVALSVAAGTHEAIATPQSAFGRTWLDRVRVNRS